jgi:hypothetical protein
MTESPEYKALLDENEPEEQIPDPDQFPEPEDMSEADQKKALKEHRPKDVGGPGGIVNYDEKLAPEDWEYVEGESTPKEEKS